MQSLPLLSTYLVEGNKEEGQVLIFRENITNQQYVGMSLKDILCFGSVYANRRVEHFFVHCCVSV